MQKLMLADDLMPLVKNGIKHATCRTGYRDIKPGPLKLEATNGTCVSRVVMVKRVVYTTFNRLTEDEIRKEAFDKNDLFQGMKSFYPDFTMESPVTFIQW